MKYLIIVLSFFMWSCNKKKDNNIECLDVFLSQKQVSSVISTMDYFDKYLKLYYPKEINENERIYLFILDFESNFLSKENKDLRFINSLNSFEPYIKDLEKSSFFELVKSENYYIPPLNLDEKVRIWADSIYNSEFEDSKQYKFIDKKNQPISTDKSNQPNTQSACGYINIFIYALSNCSTKKSIEQEII